MINETVINVKNVKKTFLLPKDKNNSIKRKITQIFKRKQKGYDIQHALKDISFEVKKGEFFGILGRNGSGKSTLLKIIAEIYRPTAGSVSIKGKLVPFIELGVGFNPELSGRENVYLNGALLGFSKKEIDDRYDKIVEFAELKEFMEQKLKNYSSGMKVRLAFSVAIQADADILILDEVLAVGDAAFQRKCYDYFRSLKDQHKTIVFVTHNMSAVREYCDRVILIEDGKIAFEGGAEDASTMYLKLFARPETNKNRLGGQSDRWGGGDVVIKKIKTSIEKNELLIDFTVKNDGKAISGIVMGVDIYDNKRKLVGGFESHQCIGGKKLFFDTDEEKIIRFSIPNIFGGGDYSVTASVKLEGGIDIFDFWRNATQFSNAYETNEYFPVILPAKLSEM